MLRIRKMLLSRWLKNHDVDLDYIVNMGHPKNGYIIFIFRVLGINLFQPRDSGEFRDFDEYERTKTDKKNKKNGSYIANKKTQKGL